MLFKLLGAPLALPASGIKFVFQQIADLADAELNDDSVVHEQLLLLQVQLEEGDIEEDEYVERETELLQRLREIKARKREQQQQEREEIPPEADVTARRRFVVETPFDEA
jgi:Gas vesicle protein G